jgi:tetratricopeptide (TPR) repeat protein
MAVPQRKIEDIQARLEAAADLSEFALHHIRAECEDLLRTDGDDAEVFNALGLVCAQLDRRDQALHAFVSAFQLAPDDPTFVSNAAIATAASGENEAGLELLLDAVDRFSACRESPVVLATLASLFTDDFPDSARSALQDALLRIAPGTPTAPDALRLFDRLGLVAFRLSEYATAAELWARWLAGITGTPLGEESAVDFLTAFDWGNLDGAIGAPDWAEFLVNALTPGEFASSEPVGLDHGLDMYLGYARARLRATEAVEDSHA